MLEKELSFADLSISLSELYEAMGYADAVPDEAVEKEVRAAGDGLPFFTIRRTQL